MFRALAILLLTTAATAAESTPADQGPWWLGPLVTIVAAVIGASAIVWQLGRQHRNESQRQAENFKSQLKLQVYQEFSAQLSTAADSIQAVAMYAFTAPTHIEIYNSQVASGFTPAPIVDRALKLLELNSDAADEVVETVFLVEKYFIIHPDVDIFRLALGCGSHNVSQAFHPLFQFMLANFPMEVQTEHGPRTENVLLLTAEQRGTLKSLTDRYHESAMDLGSYLDDMRTELQTLLLSHLFPHIMARRRPADPSKKVISLEPSAVRSLRQHFLKNTAWGKSAVATQLDVHREFHGRV